MYLTRRWWRYTNSPISSYFQFINRFFPISESEKEHKTAEVICMNSTQIHKPKYVHKNIKPCRKFSQKCNSKLRIITKNILCFKNNVGIFHTIRNCWKHFVTRLNTTADLNNLIRDVTCLLSQSLEIECRINRLDSASLAFKEVEIQETCLKENRRSSNKFLLLLPPFFPPRNCRRCRQFLAQNVRSSNPLWRKCTGFWKDETVRGKVEKKTSLRKFAPGAARPSLRL